MIKNKQRVSWELSEEEKKKINQREISQANNYTNKEKIDLRTRENHGNNSDDIEISEEVKDVTK